MPSEPRPSGDLDGEDASSENRLHVAFIRACTREARRGRFSVEELARRSAVSVGLISRLERGLGNPTHSTLLKLGRALDLSLNVIVDTQERPAARITRIERLRLVMPYEGLTYEVLSADLKRRFAAFRAMVPAGLSNEKHPLLNDGDASVLMLSGELEIHLAHEVFDLKPGDSSRRWTTPMPWLARSTAVNDSSSAMS